MSFNKKFFTTGGIVAASGVCNTDSHDIFPSGVALYSLDYDASDASGLYDGTPSNVTFGVGGQINYGARFNGSSSKITTSLDFDTLTDYTISMWIKIDASPSARDFFAGTLDSSAKNGIYLANNTDETIRFFERNASGDTMTITSTDTINIGSWNHIVAVRDGGTDYLYINNGTPVSASNSTITHATGFTFGIAGAYATYFDGDIDQVRIFNTALSSSEISTLYAETACVYTCTTDTVNYPSGTTPVAYYKLDNSAEDETGSYDGTATNIEYRFGRFGQAAVYNGSSSKIVIPASTSIAQQNNYTFSAWFKTDTLGVMQTIYAFNSPSTYQSAIFIHSNGTNNIRIFSAGSNYYSSDNIYTNNQWYHIAVTKSSTNGIVAYLDGVEIINEPTATANNLQPAAGDNRIGGYKTASESLWFDGLIDQVRIYSTALTSSQVTELYNEKPCADTSNFKTVLYTGDNSDSHFISNVGFKPDFVWIKNRDDSYGHMLYDIVRGAGNNLSSDTSGIEGSTNLMTSFEETGFFVRQGSSNRTNFLNNDYVAWCWKAGGDAVTLTNAGNVNSDVSVNNAAGFSIVKASYGANGSGTGYTKTVKHGLTTDPEIIITKSLGTSNWFTMADTLIGEGKHLLLNDVASIGTDSGFVINTDGTFQTAYSTGAHDIIAYCWHSVAGYSKIGTYEGDGNTNRQVTDVGFQPNFLLIKNTENSGTDWLMYDSKRGTTPLAPNQSFAESTYGTSYEIEFISTGFKIVDSNNATNELNATIIYMAFK